MRIPINTQLPWAEQVNGWVQFNSLLFFFSFFYFLGGRPPYLPVELWKRTTKGEKERERTIYIYIHAAVGRGTSFHPGPFWRAVYWYTHHSCCIANYQHDDDIIMRTTPPFLMVFVTLRHHNIDSMFHSSIIFLVAQEGDPPPLFKWVLFDYILGSSMPLWRKLISTRVRIEWKKNPW